MMNQKTPDKIKFAFFGTPALACVFLDDLEKAGLVPSLVVTTPDKHQGRGMTLTPPPVKLWAHKRGVESAQPEAFDAAFCSKLAEEHFDLFVVIYYGKILPRAMLDIPKHGTLNIHFSLLPRWRGTSPIRAAIANGDAETGISIILLDEKIDHGPVIAQKKIAIASPDGWPHKASVLEERATHESAQLLIDILPSWLGGDIEAHEQNHDVATVCPKYTKADGLLDLGGDARANVLKVRAFDTTVGTHAFFERPGKSAPPAGGRRIRVGIQDAHIEGTRLIPDTVKPEGKKEMAYEEFLRSGARPA